MFVISSELSELILKPKMATAGAINLTMASRGQWTRLFTAIKYELGPVIPPETNMVIYEADGRPNERRGDVTSCAWDIMT